MTPLKTGPPACPLTSVTANHCYVTFPKIEELIYTAAQA